MDPLVVVILSMVALLWLAVGIGLNRNDESFVVHLDMLYCEIGLPRFGAFILLLGKTFSFGKGRQKSELAEIIKGSKEIERHLQRYQYFIEMHDVLKRRSSVCALNESQKSLLAEAIKELESLPRQVHELAQSLANIHNETRSNIWIWYYLRAHHLSHWTSHRRECRRRLGCCAASCGCCNRPRRNRRGLASYPGQPFMLMARETIGDLAHC